MQGHAGTVRYKASAAARKSGEDVAGSGRYHSPAGVRASERAVGHRPHGPLHQAESQFVVRLTIAPMTRREDTRKVERAVYKLFEARASSPAKATTRT
jgi:hypothetical protein